MLDGNETHADEVWKGLVELGVPATGIPEEYGGLGLSPLELCVIAEEMGRAAAPVPFDTSVVLATEALKLAGSEAQKKKWLSALASGEAIGTLAGAEGPQPPKPRGIRTTFGGGRLNGKKVPVADGEAATFAVVLANTGGQSSNMGDRAVSLVLVDLKQAAVAKKRVETIDPARKHAELTFKDAAPSFGRGSEGWRSSSVSTTRPVYCRLRAGRRAPRLRCGWRRLRPAAPGLRQRHGSTGDQATLRLLRQLDLAAPRYSGAIC